MPGDEPPPTTFARPPHVKQGGFTLLEIILAAAIAVVVGMIVLTLFRTVVLVRGTQDEISRIDAAQHESLLRLIDDTRQAFNADIESSRFILKTATDPDSSRNSSVLEFTTYERDATETSQLWHRPVLVRWQLKQGTEGTQLQRVVTALSGAPSTMPVTNIVAHAVAGFKVEAHPAKSDKPSENWKNEWESGKDRNWPQRIRVRLDAPPANVETSKEHDWLEVFIPITFEVERTLHRITQ